MAATTTGTAAPTTAQGTDRVRWPYAGPGQALLLLASLAVLVGSLLPWVYTADGSLSGLNGAGAWTLYAGVAGIGGALVRRRRVAAAHAVGVAVVAGGLAAWQVLHLISLDAWGAWAPGLGLLMVLGGGGLSLRAALDLRS